MIKQIDITNFKSINTLSLDLGILNVFIGENGSGKSNILEAIAFGGAASADKLDSEFFSSRGIRYTTPEMMENRFTVEWKIAPGGIDIRFLFNNDFHETFNLEFDIKSKSWLDKWRKVREDAHKSSIETLIRNTEVSISEAQLKEAFENSLKLNKRDYKNETLANFLIYSPENSFLRQFQSESQINPLGIKGEGVFRLLKEFSIDENKILLEQLKENLHLIDWFDDFDIKENSFGEKEIRIKDRYLQDELVINQANANEGFLFLLFYLMLYISPSTPSFFAIDNLEASFHPKLCTELIKVLTGISKKNGKQSLITTHNPFILDGLDLNDNDQRLFVVRRNSEGETIADRIEKPISDVKLSDAWMRGYIGGNPQIA